MTSGTWIHDRVARFEEKPALGLKDELFGIKDWIVFIITIGGNSGGDLALIMALCVQNSVRLVLGSV